MLLAEPSGFITEVLLRLEVSAEEILAELEPATAESKHTTASARPGVLTATGSAYAPASVEEVWPVISTAARMPEWDQTMGEVTALPEAEGIWEAQAPETMPGGKPPRIKEKNRRLHIRVLTAREPEAILWEISFPDAPTNNILQRGITLTPEGEGTRVETTIRWIRPDHRLGIGAKLARLAVGTPLRPVMRHFVRVQAGDFARSISRQFR